MVQKECESSIHDHDIDFSVTMVGWVDVPDSEQGDFRRRHAVNIPIYYYYQYYCYYHFIIIIII